MKYAKYVMGVFFILLVLVFAIGGFFNPFIEKIIQETPQEKVNAYISAIKRNDKEKALTLWEPDALSEHDITPLTQRRQNITQRFIDSGINNLKVLNVEWWRTCCEPEITDTPRSAGGARLRVLITAGNNSQHIYIFDVFNRELSYPPPGSNELRSWCIRDIYTTNNKPIFWKWRASKRK